MSYLTDDKKILYERVKKGESVEDEQANKSQDEIFEHNQALMKKFVYIFIIDLGISPFV